jgi:periplasmic copper chaperone A
MRLITILSILTMSGIAAAHPHITSPRAVANTSGQLITFGVSHGCDNATKDTVKIQIDIPANISSVRPLYGPDGFGLPTVTKVSSAVTQVVWEKPTFDLAGDNAYYEFVLRLRVADVPFSQIRFAVTQTCRNGTGDTVVVWDDTDDTAGMAAPILTVVPAHSSGWNKITVPAAIAEGDVPTYFGDAQILWRGTSAYSPNSAVATLIGMTPGVTALTGGLAAGDELWVKY